MIEGSIASLRAALTSSPGAEPSLGTRALVLRLVDALDRLAALFRSATWADANTPAADVAAAALPARTEFEEAWKRAAPTLGAAEVASCRDIASATVRAFSQRFAWFRSPLEPGETMPVSPAQPADFAAAPAVKIDNARFAASAPTAVRPQAPFVARFVAYADQQQDQAHHLLGQAPGLQAISDIGLEPLAHGTVIEVAASGHQLQVEGAARQVQRFVWTGQPVLLSFEAQCSAAMAAAAGSCSAALLRLDVMVDGLTLARIRLQIEVTETPRPSAQISTGHALARKAFASYASADRARVLDRVASIRLVAAVEVFVDCHDLNPGEAWQARLAREIDGCDTFLLFWSDEAAKSVWVRWEWERAVEQRGLERMQFHPLANGVQPPAALRAIQMNDFYMDLRLADRLRRTTNSPLGGLHE